MLKEEILDILDEHIWAVVEEGCNKNWEPSVGHYSYQNEYLPLALIHMFYFKFKKDHPARWFASHRNIYITSR